MQPVRWGILSTAKIAVEKVIPGIQKSPVSTVVALASRDAAKATEMAARLGIERAHDSYEALLADPDVEVIYNPLPNHLHVSWTVRAMEAGKHVLCEKPIGLTAQEARLLADATARTGKHVAEAFMVRHHPQWLRTRELVRQGAIGDARLIRTIFAYTNTNPANIRDRLDMGGGGLYDIGCYAVATARFLFEAEPERVFAAVERDPATKIDRLTSGLVAFPQGRQLIFSSATQIAPRQEVEILGRKGRIAIKVPFNTHPAIATEIVVDDARDLYGGGAVTERFDPCDQYTLQADAFSLAIREGTPLAHPIADSVMNMRIIDALFRSEKSGSWETP